MLECWRVRHLPNDYKIDFGTGLVHDEYGRTMAIDLALPMLMIVLDPTQC
jgi:hypothetical protein